MRCGPLDLCTNPRVWHTCLVGPVQLCKVQRLENSAKADKSNADPVEYISGKKIFHLFLVQARNYGEGMIEIYLLELYKNLFFKKFELSMFSSGRIIGLSIVHESYLVSTKVLFDSICNIGCYDPVNPSH